MIRLASDVWVKAYLIRLQIEGIPAHIMSRGDPTAGAIWVKLATMDGQAALWERTYDLLADSQNWTCTDTGAESQIDERIARECARDRDLWVIEIEDPKGRHLLDDPSLS